MASPREYHGLLAHSAARGDEQTFLSVAPQYFITLGEQIQQNLLYQVQRFNAITRRIWLFGFATTITTTVTATLLYKNKPAFVQTHAPILMSPHAPMVVLIATILLTCIPVGIVEMIKAWFYHLIRKTESTMHKKAKAFANDAWTNAAQKKDPLPHIEAAAFRRYESIVKNLSRFNY